MQCPVCSVPLTLTDRQGVEIDYCPQCRGVWLDRGELDKIIERGAAHYGPSSSPPRPPARRDHDDDDDYYRGKRRRNWLEELFD